MKRLWILILYGALITGCAPAFGTNHPVVDVPSTSQSSNSKNAPQATSGAITNEVNAGQNSPSSQSNPALQAPNSQRALSQPPLGMESVSVTTIPAAGDNLVTLAKQDLARRLVIDIEQITLLKVIDIIWPDISVGCYPKPGGFMTNDSVSGFQIWLQALGQTYIYQAQSTGLLVFCQNMNAGAGKPIFVNTPPVSPIPPGTAP